MKKQINIWPQNNNMKLMIFLHYLYNNNLFKFILIYIK